MVVGTTQEQLDLETLQGRMEALISHVQRVYVGPRMWPELMVVALVSRGHVLLEGVPGIAKTTLVRTFAQSLGCSWGRIQFTPDLLPSDIVGTHIPVGTTGEFELRKGPIFSQVLLGDEINRAPAKTQSALLEAMQESQVTIEGETLALPSPFIVLATQNPVEQAGTFELPEAQLDRFLMRLRLDYPTAEEEYEMLQRFLAPPEDVGACLSPEVIAQMRAATLRVHCDKSVLSYAVDLVRFTRSHRKLLLGASPRAALSLVQAGRALALARGRDFVTPDDLQYLAPHVLAHRLVRTPEAELEEFDPSLAVHDAITQVKLR